ncbi:solute carrier family 49 member 4-like [Watersipora subatra]|uniref:solute carrier family 49 member 4-like n=1 Tax=Watersipora subatra TaxID=2589382 RepID=UPI00355C3845
MASKGLDETSALLASKSSKFDASEETDSSEPKTTGFFETIVYCKRWYMLAVFSFVAFTLGSFWNTWSPLGDALLIGFGWTNNFIALSLTLTIIGNLVFSIPIMYLIERYNFRVGAIFSVSLLLGTALVWNIAYLLRMEQIFVCGCLLSGIAACLAFAGPPLLSVIWFPVAERTTATALASMSTHFGAGLSFIISPSVSGVKITAEEVLHYTNVSDERKEEVQDGLHHVVYFDTILAVVCFLLVAVHFPARPPTPPSRVQTRPRTEYWKGLKEISCNGQFWIMAMAFNISNGAYIAWLPMLSLLIANSLRLDAVIGDYIGFVAIIVGCFGTIVIAFVVDRYKRHTKLALLILSAVATALYILLACIQSGYIVIKDEIALVVVLYLIVVGIGICMNARAPLCYELGCEIAYPVPEGLAAAYITTLSGICGTLFYLIFFIPGLDENDTWTTWACVIACAVSIPMFILLKESYKRLNEETPIQQEKERQA